MIAFFIRFWHKWGTKVSFTIFDQIVFSAANLVLNIFLARWLMPAEYGIFVIILSIFLFMSGFYQALVLEPMKVIGAAHYDDRLDKYVGVTVWIHLGLTLGFSFIILLAAIATLFINSSFSSSFFSLAIAIPLLLFFWLFRQVCYLQMKPKLALKGSLTYSFVLFVALTIFYKQHWLSSCNALLIMGISSLLAALTFWSFLSVGKSSILGADVKKLTKKVLIENWRYSKWIMGSAFSSWLSVIIYLPMVGVFVGLSQAGAFRAMQNMVVPVQRIFAGLGLLLLPWLSRQRIIQDGGNLKRKILKIVGGNVLFSSIYVIVLVLFKQPIARFLYGDSYYIQFLWLVPYLGLVVIITSFTQGLSIGLKALERSDAIFWSQAVGSVTTLTFGLWCVYKFGLYGAAIGSLLTVIIIALMLGYFFIKFMNKSSNFQSIK